MVFKNREVDKLCDVAVSGEVLCWVTEVVR